MNIKNYIKKYAFLVILLAMIVFAANISKKTTSLTLTRYKSSVTGSDTSRVAKWEIHTLSSSGEENNFDLGFRTTIIDEGGCWAFEISNVSEVDGEIDENSYIRIRLDNESYNILSSDQINWNFIKDSNDNATYNPIIFKLSAYKNSLSKILEYKNSVKTISYEQYMENPGNYNDYIPVVKNSVIESPFYTISSSGNYEFKKSSELVDSKIVYYYYLDIKLGDKIKDLLSLPTVGTSPSNTISFIIGWDVTESSSGSTNEGLSSTTDNNKYSVYKIASSKPEKYEDTVIKSFTGEDRITYNVYQKKVNFFDYTLYVSALTGGEPNFEFKADNEFDVVKVKYSSLNETQINEIKAYENNAISSYVDLKHYVEYLEYTQYANYLKESKAQQEALGYLSYGLKVNINFNLYVKQTDPNK